jgi:NAD(P)-dependent dehydrogenase (short-subunit alcohol dehydrogenase family)
LTTEQFEATLRTNVLAILWLCKAALPHLPPGATIINTTSIQSYQPSPGLLDYASSKAAITAFTHALAKQVAAKGIRVNAVALVRYGHRCSRAAASRRKRSRSLVPKCPCGGRGNPPSSRLFMFCWLRRNLAS